MAGISIAVAKSAENYPGILHLAHDFDKIFIAFDI
jgi:hypothetical protein